MTVYLVGAGPGDPGLITARGLDLIRSCDVLVHDRLVARELVDEAPSDALVISRAGLRQAALNGLLIELGREGRTVVRLKGGDPYVFGRGGEEALALAEADVAVEVVPGVSALAAVPAAAGIPVTHRGVADSVTLTTGHGADGSPPDYEALARIGGTLVLFMGLARLPEIVKGLIGAGLDPATPAAVVSAGTLPEQQTMIAPLAELASAAEGFVSPALVVVGSVVSLADAIAHATGASLIVAS
jgi:uroporphyrin-III C-methyltransferase